MKNKLTATVSHAIFLERRKELNIILLDDGMILSIYAENQIDARLILDSFDLIDVELGVQKIDAGVR